MSKSSPIPAVARFGFLRGDSWYGGSSLAFEMMLGSTCDSDFIPCGLPMPSLGQSIWSDVLGLPTNLNCPRVGGLSDYLCGGLSPVFDATNIGQQQQEAQQVDAIYAKCQQEASAASGPMMPSVYQWETSIIGGLVSVFGPGGAGTILKFVRGVGITQGVTFVSKTLLRTSIFNSCLRQNGISAPSPNGVR